MKKKVENMSLFENIVYSKGLAHLKMKILS